MEELARAVEAADSFWPVMAIAIIGLYVLIWKFGRDLLQLSRQNHQVAVAAKDKAVEVLDATDLLTSNIQTNHESTSLGNAIDNITEALQQHLAEYRKLDERVAALLTDVRQQGLSQASHCEHVASELRSLGGRLDRLEGGTHAAS